MKMKKSHWVTQSYLRAFAADPERREKIWRFGKTDGDPELKPIEKVAVKFYLYAPKDADGKRDYAFEKRLSSLEQFFGDRVWLQACNDMVPLGWEPLRKMVALLAAVMYLRNPAQFEVVKAMHRQIVDALEQLPALPEAIEHDGKATRLDRSSWPAYRDADENDLKRHWLSEIGSANWLAEVFVKMRWAVVFSDQPVFVTSDHPVAFVHPSLGFRGLRDPEAMVYFPLSPTRILVMDNRHHEPADNYYPIKVGAGAFNLVTWRNATEYMFSHRSTDLVCAEMLQEAHVQGYG
jgi:hypothetical protein